jgi:hypothetical protein
MGLRSELLVWSILGLTTTPGWLPGQGITTAALEGTVTQTDGTPIEAATVEVTNSEDGRQWRVETRSGGRYHLENVAVGGPYRIAARAVGWRDTGTLLRYQQPDDQTMRQVVEFERSPELVRPPATDSGTHSPIANRRKRDTG